MVRNKALQTIIKTLQDRRLGEAMEQMANFLYTNPQPQATELLEEIKTDYQLMTGYWRQGYADDQRGQLYDRLLRRMYMLTTSVSLGHYLVENPWAMSRFKHAYENQVNPSTESMMHDLQDFVSDVAMLELEPEHTRQQKQQAVYERHEQMMSKLFDYLWTSWPWSEEMMSEMEGMVLSPTVDAVDQQLMVSGIMLSLMNFWDARKFRLLVDVYRKTADERIRQRALIGWVFCLDSDACRLYTEIADLVREVTEDERCCNELAELQMQLLYCLQAESDTRKIQEEIMPELLKNNHIRVTRNGIEEVEEDTLEDILHPELSEQRMEQLEANIQKMMDMQKQGVDIYYGGFSQMKRYPFFGTIANWFVPYYPQHPGISTILGRARGKKFLKSLLSKGPFCDSDKYSFVIAFDQTMNMMPENLLKMLDQGEASLVGTSEVAPEELSSPAFMRRSYLQNLYRFYKVFPQRSLFVNPFDTADDSGRRYVFFANPLLRETRLASQFGRLVAFFIKHHQYDAAAMILQNYPEQQRDAQFYLMNGSLLMRTHKAENAGLTTLECFEKVVELEPDNERAWVGYARVLFGQGDYEKSLQYYRKLLANHPDHQNYLLNAAVCLTNMRAYEEALGILYKLNYDDPENTNISRVLAWALTGAQKYEQAGKIYQELLHADRPEADDYLNAAYMHWFNGDVNVAVGLFSRYANTQGITFNAIEEFFGSEYEMIAAHGIGDTEIRLMAEALL